MKTFLGLAAFAGLWLFAAVATLSIAMQNVIFVGFGAWVALLIWERRVPKLPAPFGGYDLFVLWALAASLISVNAWHSVDTWKKWLLAYTALYAMDALRTRRSLQAVMGALLLFSGIWALGSSLLALSGPAKAYFMEQKPWAGIAAHWIIDTEWRARSGSGGYQVLASCTTMLLAFFGALALSEERWRRPLPLVCLASLGLALVLTMTRGAWIAAAAAGAFLLAFKRPAWLLGAAALAAALVLLFPSSVFVGRLKTLVDPDNDSNKERLFMYEAGASIIRERPWLGVGDSMESFEKDGERVEGNYRVHRSREAVEWYEAKQIPEIEQGHLHSNFIQLAAMYGLPGLLLLLLFFGRLFAMALKAGLNRLEARGRGVAFGLCAALIAWWVNGTFEYNFGSMQSSFVMWFLVGLYFASREAEFNLGGAPV